MCDECYRFLAEAQPACARCAYEATSRGQRRISIAVTLIGLSWSGAFLLSRRDALWERLSTYVVLTASVATVTAALLAYSARKPQAPKVTQRPEEPDEVLEADESTTAAPYRMRLRRVLRPRRPRISGTLTALVLLGSLAGCGLAFPLALQLPKWIEIEIVLAMWWVSWTALLARLLYRGYRIDDDWLYFAPWERKRLEAPARPRGTPSSNEPEGPFKHCTSCGCDAGLDSEIVVVVAVAVAVLFGAAWVLVELAAPLLFFAAYSLLLRAVRRVASDRHDCERNGLRAVGWAAAWATVYLAPLAVLAAFLRV